MSSKGRLKVLATERPSRYGNTISVSCGDTSRFVGVGRAVWVMSLVLLER
jgi:hypothetical protein